MDILVGDVMGKGVPAALLGAATKSQFVRSLAQLQSSLGRLPQPQEVVGSVHDHVTKRFVELDSFATALYARFDLDEGAVDFVDCGHPKMIHYHGRTGECSFLDGRDLPLGFSERHTYRQDRAHFESGDMFVLYTDGLTEVFSPEDELLGEDRILDLVTAKGDRPVAEVVDGLRRLAEDFAGGRDFRDDFTLAVVRVSDVGPHLPGTVERVLLLRREAPDLSEVRRIVGRICQQVRPDADPTFSLELQQALQEVLTNVIRHSGDSAADTPVEVRFRAAPESVQVEVLHEGIPFEPKEIRLPDLEDYPEGGFGLYIIHESVELAQYGVLDDGRNVVRLIKWFRSESDGDPGQG
jgi:anti-sigma regulatory factor (Ser/Thr protein kinase)